MQAPMQPRPPISPQPANQQHQQYYQVKNPNLIGTAVPPNWVANQHFLYSGPIQVGDLVVICVSDGSKRYAEVSRQSGPDSWDVLLAVQPQHVFHPNMPGSSLGRPAKTSMTGMREQHFYELKHPDLIDTAVPAGWAVNKDFTYAGPVRVGDLVVIKRSDGSLRFAEIWKQSGPDTWDLVVCVHPRNQFYCNQHGSGLGRPKPDSLKQVKEHKAVFETWNKMEQEDEGLLLQQSATINRAKEYLTQEHPKIAPSQSWVSRAGHPHVSMNPEDWGKGFPVEASYTGPHLTWPLTLENVQQVLYHIRTKPEYPLHPKYIAQLVGTGTQMFDDLPASVATMSIPPGEGGKLVVLGDTHGQLADLLWVLELYGEPSQSTGYLINGDMADRGTHAVEIIIIALMFKILYPENVVINRGNHEALDMNRMYGFGAEVEKHHPELYMMFQNLFKVLPLATVIGEKVFVVHGGLPRDCRVEIKDIKKVDRKVMELARPTNLDSGIMWDCLWSDPMEHHLGIMQNPSRGEDVVYFGPDITHHFLNNNHLNICIRSHQVPKTNRGFEYCHGGRLITLFTASNYCGCTNNTGAAAIIRANLVPELIEHMAPPLEHIRSVAEAKQAAKAVPPALMAQNHTAQQLSIDESVARMREDVLAKLEAKVVQKKDDLWLFWVQKAGGSDKVSLQDWRQGMTTVLGLDVQWETVEDGLVEVDANGEVDYMGFLQKMQPQDMHGIPLEDGWETKMVRKVYEQVLRCDWTLEDLQKHFDPDGDGLVSPVEFKDGLIAANLEIPEWQISSLLRTIERNEIGKLSLANFLDRFQVVYSTDDSETPETSGSKTMLNIVGKRLIGDKSRMDVFRQMDTDGNGFVDQAEFFDALTKLKLDGLTDEQKHDLWRSVDITKDGRLNYLEFCAAFEIVDTSDVSELAQKEMVSSILAVLNQNKQALGYTLSYFDTNLNGKVTREEFKSALRALNFAIERPDGGSNPFTEEQLDVVAEYLKADEDGMTDVSHFFSSMSIQC